MRIMHVIAPAAFGGAETVVRGLVAARARACSPTADTMVATLLADDAHPFVRDLRAAGVRVEPILTGPRQYRKQTHLLVDCIRRFQVDLVHTHVYHADLVGSWAARQARRPVVATVHGYVGGSLRNRLYEAIDRRILRQFDAVICVSQGIRQRLLAAGCHDRQLRLIPNALAALDHLTRAAAREALRIPKDALVIGWIGRMSAEKGPDLLLSTLIELGRADVVAVMIGDGPLRRDIERQVAADPKLGNVRIAGSRPDASRLHSAFDVLAITSRTEGLPMVMLEAIATGTPIAGFAVGGVGDYLGSETAWLTPPGDTVALARVLAEALESPEERRRRAEAARKRMNPLSAENDWIEAVETVYHTVASGGQVPSPVQT